MTYFFNTVLIFTLLLFQTTIAPKLDIHGRLFDLMIVFVAYSAIYRPVKEGVFFTLFTGLLTDSLSSGPFGLYISVYIWIFMGIRWILNYLHAGNFILVPFIIAGAILTENLLIGAVTILFERAFYFPPQLPRLMVTQMIWGLFVGPLLVWTIKNLHFKWEKWVFEKVFKHIGQ